MLRLYMVLRHYPLIALDKASGGAKYLAGS